MLDKETCKKCHQENGEEWNSWKEREWQQGWEVPPVVVRDDVKTSESGRLGNIERLMKNVSRAGVTTDSCPPEWCPHLLEHLSEM